MGKKNDPFGYVAKYVTKQGGDIHFGGMLENVNFSDFRKALSQHGRKDIVQSVNLDWRYFHLNDPRRKK